MVDNIYDEHLDNPTDTQSENPSDDTTPTKDTETITQNQETENMEVHHHAHHEGKKNWKSYIWEFLMLFLAVFCGFLAEYQLEHKIEKDRAAELAKSFYEELKVDYAAVKSTIRFSDRKDSALQYLKHYFRDSSLTDFSKEFGYNYGIGLLVNRPAIFEPRGAILELLINSGSLRYFKSKELQKMTIDLSIAIKEIKARNERINRFMAENIDPFLMKHLDEEWYNNVQLQFKGDFRSYLKSNKVIPFHFYNLEKFDKIEDINRLSLFSAISRQNAAFYYVRYDSLNTTLVRELKKEYRLD